MKRPDTTSSRPTKSSRQLHESTDKLIETIALDCYPDAKTIPKLKVNDLKRLSLILSAKDKARLLKALTKQQRMFLPSGVLA